MSNPSANGVGVELSGQDPWPGLAAFSEESTHFFKGREREAEEVSRLIRREFLCVLFGKSGMGKSSLLRAGVFPRLHPSGFYPVYVRLRHEETEPALSEQVKQALTEAIKTAGNEIEATEPKSGQSLWQYFYAVDTEWWDRKSHLITPVLVFDQFEEILTLGFETEARAERANRFLSELEDLIEGRVPDELQKQRDSDPAWRSEFDRSYNPAKRDLRIVLTLREDFLADLESLRERLKPVMLNRYRLLPMNGSQALQVVEEPAPGLVDEPVALQIIQRVSISERSRLQTSPTKEQIGQRTVEPALLSVFCAELNLRRKARGLAKIDETLLEGAREEILSDFYERSFAGLPSSVRDFVEDKLLTVTGARDRCEVSNVLSYDSITEAILRTLINRRLIRKEMAGSSTWIELTHDTIADVARASKRSRQERARIETAENELRLAREQAIKRNRQHNRAMLLAAGCSLLCLIAVIMAINAWVANQENIKVHGELTEMESRKRDLEKAVVELESTRQRLQKTTGDLVQASATNLEAYTALAAAALLDPYPRSDMLLTRSDFQAVRNEFAAIKESLATSGNTFGGNDGEFLVVAERVIEEVLKNDLGQALKECDQAIGQNGNLENETRSKLLLLKGDILVRQVAVMWYSTPDLQSAGSTDPRSRDLLTKLNDAFTAYESALALITGNTAREAILLTRQARAKIWRSRLEPQAAADRDSAARLIEQAKSRIESATGPKEEPLVLRAASIEVLRMQGFLNVCAGDDKTAASFYERSIVLADQEQADHFDKRISPGGLITEKLLALVQLANCYERLIKSASGANPSISVNDYKIRLANVLAQRIELARQILTKYRSSRYVAQILGFSYYDQGRCCIEYSLPGLSPEESYGSIRLGFIMTLSDKTDRGEALRDYFQRAVATKWGSQDVAKALTDEMKKAMSNLQWLFQENKQAK